MIRTATIIRPKTGGLCDQSKAGNTLHFIDPHGLDIEIFEPTSDGFGRVHFVGEPSGEYSLWVNGVERWRGEVPEALHGPGSYSIPFDYNWILIEHLEGEGEIKVVRESDGHTFRVPYTLEAKDYRNRQLKWAPSIAVPGVGAASFFEAEAVGAYSKLTLREPDELEKESPGETILWYPRAGWLGVWTGDIEVRADLKIQRHGGTPIIDISNVKTDFDRTIVQMESDSYVEYPPPVIRSTGGVPRPRPTDVWSFIVSYGAANRRWFMAGESNLEFTLGSTIDQGNMGGPVWSRSFEFPLPGIPWNRPVGPVD